MGKYLVFRNSSSLFLNGYSIYGLCITFWTNEFLGSYSNYKFIISFSMFSRMGLWGIFDVQGTHGEGGENTSRLIEEAQIGDGETDRVDGPANGEDDLQGVESGLGGGGRKLGSVHGGLTGNSLVQDVQPASTTEDEANELGHDIDLSQPSEEDHEEGGEEHAGTQGRVDRARSLQDQVELDNLKRDGDQPIGVTEGSGGDLSVDPLILHEGVVVPCDSADQTGAQDGVLPLLRDQGDLDEKEESERKHHVAGDEEGGTGDIVRSQEGTAVTIRAGRARRVLPVQLVGVQVLDGVLLLSTVQVDTSPSLQSLTRRRVSSDVD